MPMMDVDAPNDTENTFDLLSLRERVEEIEGQLRLFRTILDRTITGVLVRSNTSKCLCLVSGL